MRHGQNERCEVRSWLVMAWQHWLGTSRPGVLGQGMAVVVCLVWSRYVVAWQICFDTITWISNSVPVGTTRQTGQGLVCFGGSRSVMPDLARRVSSR